MFLYLSIGETMLHEETHTSPNYKQKWIPVARFRTAYLKYHATQI